MAFQDIVNNVSISKRCARLFEMFTKLSFAREESVTREFFEVYFKILNGYVMKEKNRPEQTRESWVREQVSELVKSKYQYVRV